MTNLADILLDQKSEKVDNSFRDEICDLINLIMRLFLENVQSHPISHNYLKGAWMDPLYTLFSDQQSVTIVYKFNNNFSDKISHKNLDTIIQGQSGSKL